MCVNIFKKAEMSSHRQLVKEPWSQHAGPLLSGKEEWADIIHSFCKFSEYVLCEEKNRQFQKNAYTTHSG